MPFSIHLEKSREGAFTGNSAAPNQYFGSFTDAT